MADELKSWKEKNTLVEATTTKAKTITATLKYVDDEKITKKLVDFCTKNNIELTIK